MSDNAVSNHQTNLFTLTGPVAVHFVDGQTLEGEFATQDAFNIFLTVDGEAVMIPRHQIRLIKGTAGQPIEADRSQAQFDEEQRAEAEAPPSPPAAVTERETTAEYAISPPPEQPTAEEPSQLVSEPTAEEAEEAQEPLIEMPGSLGVEQAEEEDEAEAGTLVISPEEAERLSRGAVEEEDRDEAEAGTLVISPEEAEQLSRGAVEEKEDDEDEFSTLVLETGEEETPALGVPLEEEDETFDMTVVLGDDSDKMLEKFEEDEEQATISIGSKQEEGPLATLTCTSGPHVGEVFELNAGITTLGRASDNMIALSGDKEISRRHAIIGYDAGTFLIQDQNSLNGTFVNDALITGPQALNNGDEILLGISNLKFET